MPKPNNAPQARCLFTDKELIPILEDEKLCALLKLSDKQRRIMILHIIQGISFRTIGTLYGVSGQRIHMIYLKAKKKIKKEAFFILRQKCQMVA